MSDPLDVSIYVFLNDERELRCGWRVLAFMFFLVLAGVLVAGLTKVLTVLVPSLDFLVLESSSLEHLSGRELIRLFVSNISNLAAAAIATAVCARWLERRSFASVGFKLHRRWSRDFGLGSLMGAASLAVAVGIAAAAGALSFQVQTRDGAHLVRGLVVVLLFFLISGAVEELIFRGFPFQALAHNLGGPAAIGITSVVFGLAHLSNDNATAFSTINTILAGVWLGLAYLMTRSLWLATALHYSWNFAMVFIFGLPVSGFVTLNQLSWLRGSIGTPTWVSGGNYGPEGGIATTAALVLSTLVIWKSGLFTPAEEMLAAIKHGKRQHTFVSISPEKQEPMDLPAGEDKQD